MSNSVVGDCKTMYKSIRDSVRYRQKKVGGKSGDSGDESAFEEPAGDTYLNDAFAFLMPTPSKFPRKTMILGGAASSAGTSRTNTPTTEVEQRDSDGESRISNYSYVSIRK